MKTIKNENNTLCLNEIKVSYEPINDVLIQPIIESSDDANIIFRKFWSPNIGLVEESNVMYLRRNNRVLGIYHLSKGGFSATLIDYRLIFCIALKVASFGIILAHNHPSGSLKPSDADIELTKCIVEGAKLLNLKLIDHLILSPYENSYYSFADDGKI